MITKQILIGMLLVSPMVITGMENEQKESTATDTSKSPTQESLSTQQQPTSQPSSHKRLVGIVVQTMGGQAQRIPFCGSYRD